MLQYMQFYNTLSRKKELFQPIVSGYVGIYFCGPTVYSDPHLGHARGPIVFDIFKRWLELNNYKVRLVSNITDVGHLTDDSDDGEDKLLKRAKLEQLEPMEIAEKYFWAYFDAMDKLGVRRPDIVPRASGHIGEQIELTSQLIERGLAYEANGSVYFDVSKWQSYGELSGRDPDELLEGARVEIRSEKDDPRDFALWKRAEPNHIMRWQSPWGKGFPGWHLECSVMSTKYLGEEFDIHGGGLDLIFPHHECEIAQAKAAGKSFARYWLHWNFITLEGEKMSKSKGHFKTLAELFRAYDPLVIRFNLLSSHYRSISDFSADSLHASAQGLRRIRESYSEVVRLCETGLKEGSVVNESSKNSDSKNSDSKNPLASYCERFAEAMNDDLNTPQALAVIFDVVREVNAELAKTPTQEYLSAAKSFYETYVGEIFGVLGNIEETNNIDIEMLAGLVKLVTQQRDEARLRRDFKTSDAIRDSLNDLGIVLEDTTEGTRWKLS